MTISLQFRAREMIAGVLRTNEQPDFRWGEARGGAHCDYSRFFPEMVEPEFRDHAIKLCNTFGLAAYFSPPCELDGWVFVSRGKS